MHKITLDGSVIELNDFISGNLAVGGLKNVWFLDSHDELTLSLSEELNAY